MRSGTPAVVVQPHRAPKVGSHQNFRQAEQGACPQQPSSQIRQFNTSHTDTAAPEFPAAPFNQQWLPPQTKGVLKGQDPFPLRIPYGQPTPQLSNPPCYHITPCHATMPSLPPWIVGVLVEWALLRGDLAGGPLVRSPTGTRLPLFWDTGSGAHPRPVGHLCAVDGHSLAPRWACTRGAGYPRVHCLSATPTGDRQTRAKANPDPYL